MHKVSVFADRYWTAWLIGTFVSFLWLEIYSLVSRHPQNTLSDWVWRHLHIQTNGSILNWSAADLLTFVVYLSVFVAWLPWHFWFRKFR